MKITEDVCRYATEHGIGKKRRRSRAQQKEKKFAEESAKIHENIKVGTVRECFPNPNFS